MNNKTQSTLDRNKNIIIEETAKYLIDKNGSTTTLEVKNYLRIVFPKNTWTQEMVSNALISWQQGDSSVSFTDNGTYRVYSIGKTTVVKSLKEAKKVIKAKSAKKAKKNVVKLSRSKLLDLMRYDSKGRFFGVTFDKNDGTERVLNIQVKSDDFSNTKGYIKARTSAGDFKLVDSRTVKKVTLNGKIYKAKN